MFASQPIAELPPFDNPLGDVEMMSRADFGMRAAALAGVAATAGARDSAGVPFAAATFTQHITCSSHTFMSPTD